MRVFQSILRNLAVGVPAALLAAGCELPSSSNDAAPNGDPQESTDLNSATGGYTFKTEAVAFDDPTLESLDAEEGAAPEDLQVTTNDSTFAVRFLWGQLRGNPNATTLVDWSGSFSMSRGGFKPARLIGFERGDHLVLPRENRQTLAFVSHTQTRYDGMLLLLRDVPGADPTTLTMTTGPYTQTWTLEELKTASLVITVDADSNAVSISGMQRRPKECPSGFTRGVWMRGMDPTTHQPTEGRGLFGGLWMSHDGRPLGFIRGHWGTNDQGEKVWFGKIAGRDGRATGLARGTWAPNADAAQPGGTFTGSWVSASGARGGDVSGRYVPGTAGEQRRPGFFEGQWHAVCDVTSNP